MGRSGAAPLLLGGGISRVRKKKRRKSKTKAVAKAGVPRRRKLTLKRAAKKLAKMLFVHLVQIPEEEREERIAYVGRQVAKRLEKLREKAKSKGRGGKTQKRV
jgi:hypothetical protein